MNIQVETVMLKDGSRIEVIRDVEKVRRVVKSAEHMAARLRTWLDSTGGMICEGDLDALYGWDALSFGNPK